MKSEISEIHVLIADDHPVLRRGLQQVIESNLRLKIVAEAGDGETALNRIEQFKPHIAVLDVDMPGLSGLAVAQEIVRRKLPVEIVFLTIHGEEDLFHAALETGAKGYLLKESALTEIVSALLAVAGGQHYITPSLTAYLVQRSRQFQALEERQPGLCDLTPTERHILSSIAALKSSKEIAAELFIHYRTVENHRTNICQKLGIHGHNALFKFALLHKAEL
jgi:DNA-binding NarL/FixJ family response regulator